METFEELEVTNAMVPPTALRKLKASNVSMDARDVDLRVLVSAGEALDAATAEWCQDRLGTKPQDAYGQTEIGLSIANFAFDNWETRPESMGRTVPGWTVALLDKDGTELGDDEVGEIAVWPTGSPRLWQYWGRPYASLEKFSGRWHRTGDLARRDGDGYYWFVYRKDSVIISSSYRIGPGKSRSPCWNTRQSRRSASPASPTRHAATS